QSRNSGHRYVGSLDTAPLNLAALRPVTRQLSSSKIREETCTRLRRGRVPTACTGAAFSRRPLARIVPRGHAPRIENPGTGPRTCANGSMSTSEASCPRRELTAEALRLAQLGSGGDGVVHHNQVQLLLTLLRVHGAEQHSLALQAHHLPGRQVHN